MISLKHSGDFKHLEKFFENAKRFEIRRFLTWYGEEGARALAAATPKDSGLTAGSWGYEIRTNKGSISLVWTNSNIVNGVPIAVILQYGHGTRNGGYVQGRDYVNPAIRPVFDKIAEEMWWEVAGK